MADETKTLADYMKEYYATSTPSDTLTDGMKKFMEQAQVELGFTPGAP